MEEEHSGSNLADPKSLISSKDRHVTEIDGGKVDEVNDSPIEQVRLTVPITDDPTLPCLTFRTWFLGIISCGVLAFLNQFFGYRQNPLYISSVSAQIVVLPIGKLMAATLPHKYVRIPGTKWTFSLNPGPFNLKEHVLITIFANSGSNSVYAVGIITIVKAFYHGEIHPVAAMLLTQTTQRYDPDPAAKAVAAIVLTSKLGADSSLKVYMGDDTKFNPPTRMSSDVEHLQSNGLRKRKQSVSRSSSAESVVLHQLEEEMMQYTGPEGPEMSKHNQLIVEHQNPTSLHTQDGGWIARIVALLVGEDPTQSYALICGNCHMHNGQ